MFEEKKKPGIGVSKSGVGAESADREKRIKITENGKMVVELLWSEISSAIINVLKLGKLRKHVH